MNFLDFLGFQGQNVYGFVGMITLGIVLFGVACYFGDKGKSKLMFCSIILSGTFLIGLPALFI